VSEMPIVCALPPRELAARAAELLPGVARLASSRVEIEGGYRFEFVPSPESFGAIVAMIEAEHRCCRFLRFQLTVEPGEGSMWLDVTGPAGTREFLLALAASF
jgi:hypothetical protein